MRRLWQVCLVLAGILGADWVDLAAAQDLRKPGGPGLVEGGEKPVVLVVNEGGTVLGRLSGELARQAVMAVAREEFDIAVRDDALDERAPKDVEENAHVRFSCVLGQEDGKAELSVGRYEQKERGRRLGTRTSLPLAGALFPSPLVDRGGHSAENEETGPLIAAVTSAKFTGRIAEFLEECGVPRQAGLEKAEPAEVERIVELLREMSVVAQFEAVRGAHMLPPGAEKERLLAIGYANLAFLTQHQWNAANRIFGARALVYANRRASAPPVREEVETRAYAAAMAGLHGLALEELDRVGEEITPLGKVTSAYCRFREDELLALAEAHAETREVAAALACVAVASTRNEELMARTYLKTVEVAPHAFRAYDPVARSRLIALQHDLTARSLTELATSVPARLRRVKDLPLAVREGIPAEGDVLPVELAELLAAEIGGVEERAEPSWPVLGRLHQDEALLQAYRRVRFHAEGLGVPTEDEYAAARLFVGEHPLAVISMGPFGGADIEDVKADVEALEESWSFQKRFTADKWMAKSSWGPRHFLIVESLLRAGLTDEAQQLLMAAFRGADWIDDDLMLVYQLPETVGFRMHSLVDVLGSLSRVSPHNPFGPVRLILRKGAAPPEQIAAWDEAFADRPALLSVLANEYTVAGRHEEAIRTAERASELLPSYDTFRAVAVAYRGAEREEEYLASIEKAFEFPTYSLGGAMLRAEVARLFMRRGEFDKAEPHAEKAAESFSAYGFYCLLDCYTGQERWEEAEEVARMCVRRYPNNPEVWFLWCRRTGHGDLEASKQFAEQVYQQLREAPPEELSEELVWRLGNYLVAAGEYAEAIAVLEPLIFETESPGNAQLIAATYLQMGKRKEAIALLEKASEWAHRSADAARRDGIFAASLESGEKLSPEDAREMVEAINGFSEPTQTQYRARFGELLYQMGNEAEGLELLKRAAGSMPADPTAHPEYFERTQAAVWLRLHLDEGE